MKILNSMSLAPIVVGMLAITASATATTVTSDASALVGLSTCTDATCLSKDPRYAFDQTGNPGDSGAVASVSNTTHGSDNIGAASATLGTSATAGAPVLRALATSDPGNRNLSAAFALQSYTWDGTGPSTRTFGGTLTYSQLTSPGSYGNDGNGVTAFVDVFTLPVGQQFDAGATPVDNFNNLAAFASQVGYSEAGSGYSVFTDANTTASGTGSVSDTVNLTAGETYWVLVGLYAISTNGSGPSAPGSVDASHTLVTSWDSSAGLTPAATVPEPATLSLLGLGLAVVGFMRRRRST